jgi:hypothetical protein
MTQEIPFEILIYIKAILIISRNHLSPSEQRHLLPRASCSESFQPWESPGCFSTRTGAASAASRPLEISKAKRSEILRSCFALSSIASCPKLRVVITHAGARLIVPRANLATKLSCYWVNSSRLFLTFQKSLSVNEGLHLEYPTPKEVNMKQRAPSRYSNPNRKSCNFISDTGDTTRRPGRFVLISLEERKFLSFLYLSDLFQSPRSIKYLVCKIANRVSLGVNLYSIPKYTPPIP